MNPIKHMAIIMDGNGRWGLKHKNSRNLGNKEGLKTVEMVMKYFKKKNLSIEKNLNLLDEVVNITDQPNVLLCKFEVSHLHWLHLILK